MIRATFAAAALCLCGVSSEAQNPVPTPAPPAPAPATPSTKPTPAPKARRPLILPPEWPDLRDLEGVLARARPMRFDFEMPSLPPLPPMDLTGLDDLRDLDMDFQYTPDAIEMKRAMDEVRARLDFDFDMTPTVPMPDVPETPLPADIVISSAVPRALEAITRVAGMSPFERQFGGLTSDPPKPWAQSDPADSLYRLAREALNRGEYRRAAQLFGDITRKFPNSAYAADARYWRAFALYRLGGTNDLREALPLLQSTGSRYRQASLQTDAPVLATRIRGALAAQGDGAALKAVNEAAAQPGAPCDREDIAVRVEALNSLGQTDPESTTPIFRRLLARRDDCSATLRRAAVYMLGRRTDAEAMNLVIGAARNDPDIRVRSEALRFLAAMPGEQAIATIEEMARTPGNEQLQRAAIAALGHSDTPRARQSLRAIVEKNDLSENLRITALSAIDADRASDNGAYVRGVYPRLETTRLKAAAIRAAARAESSDTDQWLLSIVRNQSEPVEIRALALRYAGRSGLSIGDLTKMYDVAGDRPLREQLINLYAQRTEPEATDKLMEIARTGTDPDLRRYAISALSRKNDPRTKKLLLEIIDR